jgi:hypothetical protein
LIKAWYKLTEVLVRIERRKGNKIKAINMHLGAARKTSSGIDNIAGDGTHRIRLRIGL